MSHNRNWKNLLLFSIILMLIFPIIIVNSTTDSVEDYRFSVPEEIVEVSINLDGSADVEYWITFEVEAEGQAIDIVDIGFPNKHYDLGSVIADVDEIPVTDIRVSEVIDIGVEIHLHGSTITESGVLHVRGNQPYMVFEDTVDPDMASCEFGNTWWDSEYAIKNTNLTTRIIFPVTVNESTYTKYHYSNAPDRINVTTDGRVYFEWNNPTASPFRQYKYGISFPKAGVEWFSGVPPTEEEIIIGVVIGLSVLIIICVIVISYSRKRRRLMDYIPPFVSIPTAGPRTDLRREEVAIVLEKPVNVTIAMIILTLIEKGLLKQLSEEFSTLQPVKGAASKHLRKYERIVLTSIRPDFSIDEDDMVKAVSSLVKSAQRRLRGYSYERTVDYYERLIKDSVEKIKSESDLLNVPTEAWFWAVLDEKFIPEIELQINQQEEYVRYTPWYYHYPYYHWYWIPHGRSFTRRITRVSHPLPQRSSGGSRSGGGCACACAGCACACAGGGR